MGLADLHIHSIYSYDGTASISAILQHVMLNTPLNVIAITDHDSLQGNLEAMDLAPKYGIEVVPGCEISTDDGHLLALFLHKPVPAGLSLVETVLRVRDQGGLCIAAHPMARGTNSLSFECIRNALLFPHVAESLVGIEALNSGLVYTQRNPMVAAIAQTLPLAQVGNSDAHILSMIGQAATEFEGKTAADLRRALETATTRVRQINTYGGLAVLRDYIPRFVLRKLGWVTWNGSPQSPATLVRLSNIKQQQSFHLS